MISDACGYQSQENLYPYQGNQEEDAVKHGAPHQYERNDFGMERNGFIFAVVANIRAEVPMVQ